MLVAGGGAGWTNSGGYGYSANAAGGRSGDLSNVLGQGAGGIFGTNGGGGGGGYRGGNAAAGGSNFAAGSLSNVTLTVGGSVTSSASISSPAGVVTTPGNQTGSIRIEGAVNVQTLGTAGTAADIALARSSGNVAVGSSGTTTTFSNTGVLQLGAASGAAQTVSITGALVATAPSQVQLGASVSSTDAQSYGAVQLLRDVTLTNPASTTSSIAGVMSGAANFTKGGAGSLTLSGSNTYSGNTFVAGGTLRLGAANVIPNSSTVDLASGTTLQLNGQAETLAALTGTGTVDSASAGGALTVGSSNSFTFGGSITGSTALTKVGTGDAILTGSTLSYTGATTISAGRLVLRNDAPSASPLASSAVSGSGALVIEPAGASFTSAYSLTRSFSGLGGLRVGKSGNTQAITLAAAQSVTGALEVYGGNLTLNASLNADTTTLGSSGTVSAGAGGFVAGGKLLLLGGNVSWTNASNAATTLAASNVGSLTYSNSTALSIDTVGSTNGVSATGAVSIATATGNLSLNQGVATTLTGSATALTLNAGASSAAGTATGGNLVVTGSPSVTVGAGSTARLFSGSVAGSTGLNTLAGLGLGSGRFRYNSDEAVSNYSLALGAGLNAIYREAPTVVVSTGALSMSYGDALPALNATGALNGDASVYAITGRANSASGNLRASGTPYNITANLGVLGYSANGTVTGTLTVNPKALTATGLSSANKVYDGTTTAAASGTAALQAAIASGSGSDGKPYTGDTVSITGTAVGNFNTKDVATANTVSFSGLSLSGADAGNYTLSLPTASQSITPKALTVAGLSVPASKVYDGTLAAVVTGTPALLAASAPGAGSSSDGKPYTGDTVSITGTAVGSYNSKDVATASSVSFSGLSIANTNYSLTTPAPVAATITPKALTMSGLGSQDKVYDGTTAATVTGTAVLQTAVAAGTGNSSDGKPYTGDALSLSGTPLGNFNSPNVATANAVSFSGLSLAGAAAGNYTLTPHASSTSPRITRATLTVTANDSAKFVVQNDPAGFNGVSLAGFVNGETASVLSGTATVSRSNASTNVAGSYSGVLQASGLSASNYSISYVPGNFTIVPSNQLLVTVNNLGTTYGTAAAYSLASVQYEQGGTVYTLGAGGVSGSSVSINASNQVQVQDGANGSASFTLAPRTPVQSTGNRLAVGSYQLGASGTVTANSVNFSNTLTVVGAQQVSAKGITASASNVSKVYDGTTAMTGVSLALSVLEAQDVVNVSGQGAFASRNVGTGLGYTLSNVALSGADAGNYFLTGGTSFSGSNGAITQRPLTVSYTASSKTYDGNTSASVTASDNRVAGDLLTVSQTAAFADKNVGSGKTVQISSIALSGADAGNYSVANPGQAAQASASITRLQSVTWVGGSTGNWFDPANWGGAVPDLSNVANVVLPAGVTVSFNNTATGGATAASSLANAVNIDSLGSAGSLVQTQGFMNIGAGGMTLAGYTQSGGVLTNAGTTTLASYTQSGGSYSGTGAFAAGAFAQTGGSTALAGDLTVSAS